MTAEEAHAMDEVAQSIAIIVRLLRPQLQAIKRLAALPAGADPERAALAILSPIFASAARLVDIHDGQMALAKAALAAVAEMR